MKYESQQTQYTEKRSVADTLLETLTQTGRRPAFSSAGESRRTRSRRLGTGVAVLAAAVAAAVIALWIPRSADPEPIAVVELVRGPASLFPARSGEPSGLLKLTAARPIHAGTVIETGGGANARTAVRLASGPSVRLDAGTRVRWASRSALELERGAVYVDSQGAVTVEVRTALGIVRDVGTQFEVRLKGSDGDGTLRVRVREGSVFLERGSESHGADAGSELTVDDAGVLTRSTFPTYGPAWDWVLEAAPAPDVEGMTLRAFLDWAAREGGWDLRFADEEVAARASEIVLHGDLEGLRPSEATAAVFQGSELTYQVENGELWIR